VKALQEVRLNFKDENQPKLYLKILFGPRSKYTQFPLLKNHLMLYREIIAACSEVHGTRTNILSDQNVEFLNVKPGDIYGNH
jgi:hypothetical protein